MEIAQVISIAAMIFNILSFQNKKASGVIAFQLCGGALFAVSFIMLGAYSGGILNAVAVIRAILFLKKDTFKTDKLFWLPIFTAVYILAYIATFTIFNKEPTVINLIIECLPVIGMVATTVAFRYSDAGIIRRYSLVSSCSWLIYNISSLSIGAICCEAFSIVSIFVGMYRFDRKNAQKASAEQATVANVPEQQG